MQYGGGLSGMGVALLLETPRRAGRGPTTMSSDSSWRADQRGSTLLELLAVLAILALLVALGAGAARRAIEIGRVSRTQAELALLSSALEAFKRDYGDYPRTADAAQLLQALLGHAGPDGGTIDGPVRIEPGRFSVGVPPGGTADAPPVLLDAWGRPYAYVYKVPADGWRNPLYALYSLGPDGATGSWLSAEGYPDRAAMAKAGLVGVGGLDP